LFFIKISWRAKRKKEGKMPKVIKKFKAVLFLFITRPPDTCDIKCSDGMYQFLIFHPDAFNSGVKPRLQYIGKMKYNAESLVLIGKPPVIIKLWCTIKERNNRWLEATIDRSDILKKRKNTKISVVSSILNPGRLERMQQT